MSTEDELIAVRKEKARRMRERGENPFKTINGGVAMPKDNEDKVKLSITTEIEVPKKRIAYIICTAMEQGSGYWAQVTRESPIPEGTHKDEFIGNKYFKYFHGGWTEFGILDDTRPGWEVEPGKRYRLGPNTIKRGIQIMAEKYPRHYGDFMAETGDAITADVFLQCCLLKDIVYG